MYCMLCKVSIRLYNYAAVNDTVGLPFQFTDTYGKISFVTANGSKFNVFGFNFDDTFNNPEISKVDWKNSGGALTFDLLPTSSALTLNGIVGFSKYEIGIDEVAQDQRRSLIREYLLGLDFNYFGNNFGFKEFEIYKNLNVMFRNDCMYHKFKPLTKINVTTSLKSMTFPFYF